MACGVVPWVRVVACEEAFRSGASRTGAATALLYSHMDPSIAGMLLDSPYSDLEVLCEEVAALSGLRLPKAVLK